MSYKDERGYTKEQQGKNGAAYVMLVDTSGNPVNPPGATTEIEIKNDAGNPIPVAFPATPTVNVGNMPEVEVKNDSGNPVPVSFPATPTVNVGTLPEVEVKNDAGNALFTEPLGRPTVARQLAAGTVSANTQLTAGVKRISIRARYSDIRFEIGATAQTANASTSHFIAADERLDIAVPAGGHIAVIRDSAATANGTLCLSELV